ncbi:hypothetical protein DFH07DRAFT_399919 [Mycena maculata]|uniref:Zn(2)-C6 fungal-type domain-containing protein n=1 Tax=Mycena maculata TaxID=230809 RepID=A0AAD7NJD3_9AGAR|nr:hypothetical protein DFH07DRAFT_399919 [Mycena maculata]
MNMGDKGIFTHTEALAYLSHEPGKGHGRYHTGVENCRPSYPLDTSRGYAGAGSPAPAPRPHSHALPPVTAHESPFALEPTGSGGLSFAGHPYSEGRQWPQTIRITEVKHTGPKKQTLACFFCRSRKIACAPKSVDDTEGRTCGQCERRGFECKYPKESKRGQHNRIRGQLTS